MLNNIIVPFSASTETDVKNTSAAATALSATGSMDSYINALKELFSGYATGMDSTYNSAYTNVVDPTVLSMQALQNQLGTNVITDYDTIKNMYDTATKTAYDIEQESGAEKSYYKHLADAQNSALDTIRQTYGTAIAQGASRGMQAANQLSAILGTTATANEEATQLATDKQTRANEYASQMAENAKSALEYSNQQQMDIATLSRQLYNDQIQQQTAQLAYNQGINTDKANVEAARLAAQGSMNSSLANTAAGVYNNNQSAIAQLQAAIASANATKYAAEMQRTSSGTAQSSGTHETIWGTA